MLITEHLIQYLGWYKKSVIYYCNNFIKKLVSEAEYHRIYPTGSQPGNLYGMAKDYKPNSPLCPVLSILLNMI